MMTPMIDVVFLLLIYFVCTASFTPPELVLPSTLAEDSAAESTRSQPQETVLEQIVVHVESSPGGVRWSVNQRTVAGPEELSGILQTLFEISPELPVVLDIGPRVLLGEAVDAYDRCRGAGFQTLQFAVENRS